jgi:hypothetical protein
MKLKVKSKLLAIGITVLVLSSCFSALIFGGSDIASSRLVVITDNPPPPPGGNGTGYTINQTLSDGA